MEKDEVIYMMLQSVNNDNRELGKKSGMSDADVESQIQQSQPSLTFILTNIYEKLKEADLLA